jgi:hypothetical protein
MNARVRLERDRDDTIAAAVLIGAGSTFTPRQEEDERWTRQVVQAQSIKAD